MMRSALVKAYMTAPEKERLVGLANQAGLSVSETTRRIVAGTKLPTTDQHRHIRELVRINADLARLGNLLKLGIDEETLDHKAAMDLLAEIRMRQGEIKAKLRSM